MADTSIYVVDDEYKLIYFNEKLLQIYPELKTGEYCYQALCNESTVCDNCPLRKEHMDETLFFNKWLKIWINVNVAELDWPGHGHSRMLIAKPFEMHGKAEFFATAAHYVKERPGVKFCLIAVDIEHFMLFNEMYGREKGDILLSDIAACMKKTSILYGGVSGYFENDDFCILLPYSQNSINEFTQEIWSLFEEYRTDSGFVPAMGIYMIENDFLRMSAMYDRAIIAMESIKGNYMKHCAYYEPAMMENIEQEHQIVSRAQRSLHKGEFVFFLQPQCDIHTGKIVGAEALVRWITKKYGTVSPAVFIPMFEKNGFITVLDRYVWESVCKWMKKVLDQGGKLVPISLNISHRDIESMDVAAYMGQLIEKYQIPVEYLKIEITESAFVNDFQGVIKTTEKLRKMGFSILMDDFGSGYSSLNMLKNLEVDVLKLDMMFLDMNENNEQSGVQIVETVVNLSQRLGLTLIVEGVRSEEHVKLLDEIGCTYAQGYYFYSAMNTRAFEEMLSFESKVDFNGMK